MGSLGSIAAIWVASMIIFPTILLIFSFVSVTFSLAEFSIDILTNREDEDVVVENVKPENSTRIRIWLFNGGHASYRVIDFRYADLLLIYYVANTTDQSRVAWIPYNPEEDKDEGWKVVKVWHNGSDTELIDPVNTLTGYSGIWNPGERMEILVWLSIPANTTKPLLVRFNPVPIGEVRRG